MESAQQSTESATGLKQEAASAATSLSGRAGDLKTQLADALDSGAGVLRERASSLAPTAQGDGATTASSAGGVVEQALPRIAAQGELAASVMERGATWLRETDLSGLEGRILGQLEEHPVRTLGIAAALGFLVAGRRR
jgi:hypothetical protein